MNFDLIGVAAIAGLLGWYLTFLLYWPRRPQPEPVTLIHYTPVTNLDQIVVSTNGPLLVGLGKTTDLPNMLIGGVLIGAPLKDPRTYFFTRSPSRWAKRFHLQNELFGGFNPTEFAEIRITISDRTIWRRPGRVAAISGITRGPATIIIDGHPYTDTEALNHRLESV